MGQHQSRKLTSLAKLIIRPPRWHYPAKPSCEEFWNGTDVARHSVIVKNRKGQSLYGCHFVPIGARRHIPTIIFLHGNAGSMESCHFLLKEAIPKGIGVFAFDFSGSGNSDGEYVGMGVSERYDVDSVVEYLSRKGVQNIVLWGHSMGAATALMYASLPRRNRRVKALVVDSSFTSLRGIMEYVCYSVTTRFYLVRKRIVAMVMKKARADVRKASGVDVFDMAPLMHIRRMKDPLPVLFVHGEDDDIVPLSHGKLLYSAYPGQHKKLIWIRRCGHNDDRQGIVLTGMMLFSMKYLLNENSSHQPNPYYKVARTESSKKDPRNRTFPMIMKREEERREVVQALYRSSTAPFHRCPIQRDLPGQVPPET